MVVYLIRDRIDVPQNPWQKYSLYQRPSFGIKYFIIILRKKISILYEIHKIEKNA